MTLNDPAAAAQPIGVFDSGMGGLTVLRALRTLMPAEHFLYLGDTARLPYGTKSAATVTRYAEQASAVLVQRGIKALVVACNTASAAALTALRQRFAPLPVIGVLEPGAEAAAAGAATGTAAVAVAAGSAGQQILVLATEATVAGGAYSRALLRHDSTLRIYSRPCPLLVALAEAGRCDDGVARLLLKEYAAPALKPGAVAAVLLGCTHFPVFRNSLKSLLPAHTLVVDSAATTAAALKQLLAAQDLLVDRPEPGQSRFLATDDGDRFARIGARFLGKPIDAVELVDL